MRGSTPPASEGGEPERTTALRRRLERESERLRRGQLREEAARREGYTRGFAEGVERERRRSEQTMAHLHARLAQACREAAAAQAAISREPTERLPRLPGA